MANADIAGNGSVWIGLETTYGTPVDPTAAGVGVWMPIISETLAYTETRYYSPQIRQSAIVSDVVPAYYHVAGNIVMEVDANYLPYLLYASRHTITKTGTTPKFTYAAAPTGVGAAYPGGSARGLSILVVRNNVGFLYGGCVVDEWEFTIDNGVLRLTAAILGLSEQDPSSSTWGQTWIDAQIFGADAHSIYVDTSGTSPAFGSGRDNTFSGFTWRARYGGAAQNRINPARSANYIAYGEIMCEYETELDFLDKTEYDHMKAADLRALKYEGLRPGGASATFAGADEAVQIISRRSNYDTYVPELRGIGDLITARVTGRSIGLAGADPYTITCVSPTDIS